MKKRIDIPIPSDQGPSGDLVQTPPEDLKEKLIAEILEYQRRLDELESREEQLLERVAQLERIVNDIVIHLDNPRNDKNATLVKQSPESSTVDSKPKPKPMSKKSKNEMTEQDRKAHELKMQQVAECKHVMMLYMLKHKKVKHRFFRDELFTDRYSKKVTKLALTALVNENMFVVDYEETDEGRTAFVSVKLDIIPTLRPKENVGMFQYLKEKGL